MDKATLGVIGWVCVIPAAMVSWEANGSVLWAALHGSLSYGYLAYRALLLAL